MSATEILDMMLAENSTNGTDAFGIRRLHAGDPDTVGTRLANSYVWDDGDMTDEMLPGTCAARIDCLTLAAVNQALAWIESYRFTDSGKLALICGDSEASHDTLEDGATIIRNAEIMMVWE